MYDTATRRDVTISAVAGQVVTQRIEEREPRKCRY
jgi:hypothetical protein